MTLKSPHHSGRRSFPHELLGLFAEGGDSRHAGSRALGGWGGGGGGSSHGISCNILPAKLIQIGLDMNI